MSRSEAIGFPATLEAFKGWKFSSGPYTGDDFHRFARLFKEDIEIIMPEDSELVKFSVGHYDLSGFIHKDKKFVYFSISDVRYFPENWLTSILVRTAKHLNDYSGGTNNYTTFYDFRSTVKRLLTDKCLHQKPHIGQRETRICKQTGEEVEMIYTGERNCSDNGNPGWLCLHNDDNE